MDSIGLKGMLFFGHHGVSPQERATGQKISVDVELFLDLAEACKSDDINKALDYTKIYARVKACVKNNRFHLIEALADHIAQELLKFGVEKVSVRVKKLNPPIDGTLDWVQVSVER